MFLRCKLLMLYSRPLQCPKLFLEDPSSYQLPNESGVLRDLSRFMEEIKKKKKKKKKKKEKTIKN